jgi:hypothetical protein
MQKVAEEKDDLGEVHKAVVGEIPAPKVLHPYPGVRFDAKYPKRSLGRVNCARRDLYGRASARMVFIVTKIVNYNFKDNSA